MLRLLIVGAAALWLGTVFSNGIVNLLLPAFESELTAIDDNIFIGSLGVTRENSVDTVLMRANLRRPLHFQNWVIYPLGWQPRPAGWYQVHLSARGVLLAPLILLIVVLSWPQRVTAEIIVRMLIALPLIALLFALDAPLDLLANFQETVITRSVDWQGIRPLFQWARFLEGGGSSAVALVFAIVAISLAAKISDRDTSAPRP